MTMHRLVRASTLVAVVLLSVVGCATGPTYSTVQNTIPQVAADKGRIYFYRPGSLFGGGIQPSVLIDGNKVGDAVPGGVFYVDTKPGHHVITTSTEPDRPVDFTLGAGEVRYIKLVLGVGLLYRVSPKLVSAEVGAAEVKDLSYTGGGSADTSGGS